MESKTSPQPEESGAFALDVEALNKIQGTQRELLDTIDSLQGLGVNKFVELPQIIVVGDQSSGKSSTLEAISRLQFPSKAGVCTRFATELVLRNAEKTRTKVTIRPAAEDSPAEAAKLAKFNVESSVEGDFPKIINEAGKHMNIGFKGQEDFSKRVLRIERYGPKVPDLTLVDLPGFYHSGDEDQSAGGRKIVNDLAQHYMEKETSIILAIVSARSSLVMQKVLREIKKYDEKGTRTLGIITKPDQIEGEDPQEKILQLLRNQPGSKNHLKHGWHILRNRGEKEPKEISARDRTEKDFFRSPTWTHVDIRNKGIESLREKLRNVLASHIARSIPQITQRIEEIIKECEQDLAALGDERGSTTDYMKYLQRISTQFANLMKDGADGKYMDRGFFGTVSAILDRTDTKLDRKLRSQVRNFNRAFVHIMFERGASRTIQWEDPELKEDMSAVTIAEDLEKLVELYGIQEPPVITELQLREFILNESNRNSGSGFPGDVSPEFRLKLFVGQAEPWKDIATRHVELVLDLAEDFANKVLLYVTGSDEQARERITEQILVPFFTGRKEALQDKVKELLLICGNTGFSLALEGSFLIETSGRAFRRNQARVEHVLQGAMFKEYSTETLSTLKSALIYDATIADHTTKVHNKKIDEVVDNVLAYYRMMLRNFIENVVVLAIENQLMSKMVDIFPVTDIPYYSEEKLKSLAGETEDVKETREELREKLTTLRGGLALCQERVRGSKVSSSPLPKIKSAVHQDTRVEIVVN